ncbi:MAG: bifunctional precorrin-2 dehydrogenase/sirohydrochlorin ferrochelatase [Deltaproteobacteria bacterium]|nr:bifunctional precorrin-2 dehydrogenase/sirohydrochlorin ferrochelatase [Deltaproteobacteria bacterium]
MSRTPGLPLVLRLEGRRVLLVGAGTIAAGKLAALLRAGARVRVVAPAVTEEVARLAEDAGAEVVVREVTESDLDDVRFVVTATPHAVSRQVRGWADARRLLLLAVDDVAATDAHSPAVFERGGVTIALSSDGRAPALVGFLRQLLEAALPSEEELAEWLRLADDERAIWKAEGLPLGERRRRLVGRLCEQGGACRHVAPSEAPDPTGAAEVQP